MVKETSQEDRNRKTRIFLTFVGRIRVVENFNSNGTSRERLLSRGVRTTHHETLEEAKIVRPSEEGIRC